MSLNLILTKNKSTKEKIVSILSVKFPLTTMEIFNLLKKEHGFNGSYQAVHKVINDLHEEGIIEKNFDGIKLDKNWIEKLTSFTQSVKEKYTHKPAAPSLNEGTIHLTFSSFLDFAKFMVNDYYANHEFNPERKPCVCFWNHVYPATGVGDTEYKNIINFLSYSTHYAVSRSNTTADDFFSKYVEKLGKKCVNGVESSVKNDTFVHGDHVMEAFFHPKLAESMDRLYSEVKEVNELELEKFFAFVTNSKFKIEVIIFKNKDLAKKLTDEAIQLYENKSVKVPMEG